MASQQDSFGRRGVSSQQDSFGRRGALSGRARKLWALLALGCTGACQEPTEIRLEIATSIPACKDVKLTAIAAGRPGDVGQRAFSAETNKCESATGKIGSLVLVPSGGDGDALGVQAVTALGQMTPGSCKDNGYKVLAGQSGGCIVQRRQLRFVPHTPLTLPITMAASCIDVPCDQETTCRSGSCVPRELPDPEGCTLPGGCGGSGGSGGMSGSGGSGPTAPLALGGVHTCALTTADAVKCWGSNTFGQLGDGTTTPRLSPTNVPELSSGVAAVAAGISHTCAVTTADAVKCWGSNTFGQLGDGTTTDQHSPVGISL